MSTHTASAYSKIVYYKIIINVAISTFNYMEILKIQLFSNTVIAILEKTMYILETIYNMKV